MKRQRLDPITNLNDLPVMLDIHHMERIYLLTEGTIRHKLQKGTFRPLPFDKYPYRWLKSDVIRDFERRRTDQKIRKHGFAARRLRTAKAMPQGSKRLAGQR